MAPASLIKLVRSLSPAEKRYFKLHAKKQKGAKEYLSLFRLIEEGGNTQMPEVRKAFQKCSPEGSWDNTCIYLGKLLIETLVSAKKEKDVFFDLLHQLQEIRILKERSLEEEAFKQAKKVQQKAARHQLHWIEYYCHRYVLNYYADNNFGDIDDEQLVKLQMKGKEVLKSLHHIHDHYSLYEVLKYRLVHAGKIASEEGKKKLNDLMLSEMVLVAGKSKSFTSQKLHLLFQSFFFTDIGDYHSALKSFYQLNKLLEKNEAFLDNPPLDYLSALNGIIDSLRMLQNDSEIAYYLDKISKLDQPLYPEYFRYLVRKIIASQRILNLLQSSRLEEARLLVESIPKDIFTGYILVDEEKQSELYFYCSLVYFELGDWRRAHLFLRTIMNSLRLPEQLLISKAIRLLNIIIYYEVDDLLHLEYEIRSYKRYFKNGKLLKTERLIFRIMAATSSNKRVVLMRNEKVKIIDDLGSIVIDRYEQQLLRYCDFSSWIKKVLQSRK